MIIDFKIAHLPFGGRIPARHPPGWYALTLGPSFVVTIVEGPFPSKESAIEWCNEHNTAADEPIILHGVPPVPEIKT